MSITSDVSPLPPRNPKDYVRVEYKRKRDVEHLRKCLQVSREIGLADTMHELLFRVAHLARVAKEQEDAMYRNQVIQYESSRKKSKTNDKLDGTTICELLGGVVDGVSCRYKKYEVGVGNKKLTWDRVTPLDELKEDVHVRNQYVPSRELWDSIT